MEKSEKMTAKITFLGSGGSRFVVLTQARSSGGWILEMDGEILHIDPGPGALAAAKKYKVNLRKLTGVLVSHTHTDHYTNAELVVEAMTSGARIKRGTVIGNKYAIRGGDGHHAVFSSFHLNAVSNYKALKPGDETNVGRIKITATPTKHKDEKGIGFVFEGSVKIGYPSDGMYFNGQEKHFQGCDCLILNCLRPRSDNWPGHMNTRQALELIKKTKPGFAILQHFGMKMLKGVSFKEAKWIEEESGIKTIAAKDGMKITV